MLEHHLRELFTSIPWEAESRLGKLRGPRWVRIKREINIWRAAKGGERDSNPQFSAKELDFWSSLEIFVFPSESWDPPSGFGCRPMAEPCRRFKDLVWV